MFEKNMFKVDSFKNYISEGEVKGFQFDFKIQYYRGVSLSIIRNIQVWVDGEEFERDDIRFTIENETFTLEEMRTVIDYRWKFGQWATVTVLKDGGLEAGKHHIKSTQTIAPSYMPHILVNSGEFDFEISKEDK